MPNRDDDFSLDTPSVSEQRRRVLRMMGAVGLTAGALSLMPLHTLLAGDDPNVLTFPIKPKNTAKVPPKPVRKPVATRVLMIDAGHGGKDPGALGVTGTQEKDVVLDIARHLADKLEGVRGISVKLTRDSDEFIPLKERVRQAQNAKADLFISLHADSAPDKSARGLSAYTLSAKASDGFAEAIAHQENVADLLGGIPLDTTDEETAAILMDLAARHTKNASLLTKTTLIKKLTKGKEWPLLDSPMRSANFAVLRAPDIPSVLIETGFLSNPKDEQILTTTKNRKKIAQILARELATILNNSPFV